MSDRSSNRHRATLRLLLATISLGLIGACSPAPTATAQESVVAFTGVNVLPMDSERVLEDHTVIVRGSRIEWLGPAGDMTVPEGAMVIEGNGRYLLPGLAEMHGHIPPGNADPQYVTDILKMYVANGITTVRGMLGGPGQLDLARRVASGEIVGPTLYLAGPSFSGGSVNSPSEAESMVRAQKAEGWHLLKVHPGLTRDEYDAMARTANALNIRFAGHVPADVGIVHAIEMGQETFDHIDGYLEYLGGAAGEIDEDELNYIVDRTRDAGAWIIPTMAVWEVLLGALDTSTVEAYEELQYMPRNVANAWIQSHRNRLANPDLDRAVSSRIVEKRIRILEALNQAGVRILMGTDSPQQFSVPGFSTHREIERMQSAGMTPFEILRSGSFNVGLYFSNEDAFGTVAPGMRADLMLVAGNPLEDITNVFEPDGVMTRGQWSDRAQLDAMLSEIAERNSAP